MKKMKHLIPTILVALLFSVAFVPLSLGQKAKSSRVKPVARIPIHEITSVIRSAFGQSMEVVTDTQPVYLLGDFNGDSHPDIAVLVNPGKSKAELKQHHVKYIDVDPSSPTNGREQDPESARFHYCLGVAVIHGTAKGWRAAHPTGKYLFYECFIPFSLVPKATKIRRYYKGYKEAPPRLSGDAIYLDLEREGKAIVYWTGKTYRGYGQ
jgi:hypothetical protein